MVSLSKIYSKQQSTFSNKAISIYSKLWQETKNGSGYKKKEKNRKSNRVCKKNEKDIRESRSSVEEIIGGNEVTNRQEKKRS